MYWKRAETLSRLLVFLSEVTNSMAHWHRYSLLTSLNVDKRVINFNCFVILATGKKKGHWLQKRSLTSGRGFLLDKSKQREQWPQLKSLTFGTVAFCLKENKGVIQQPRSLTSDRVVVLAKLKQKVHCIKMGFWSR